MDSVMVYSIYRDTRHRIPWTWWETTKPDRLHQMLKRSSKPLQVYCDREHLDQLFSVARSRKRHSLYICAAREGLYELRIGTAQITDIASVIPVHTPGHAGEIAVFLASLASEFHIPAASTAGATALRAWKRTLREPVFVHEPSLLHATAALYGALTFVLDTNEHRDATTIDQTGAYVAAMREALPTGCGIRSRNYHPRRLGIWLASMTAPPDLRLPILPMRREDGHLVWATGRVTGWWTTPEIEYAQSIGYTDLVIHDGWIYEGVGHPLARFADRVESARANPELSGYAKLLGNALYGKFAQGTSYYDLFLPTTNRATRGATPIDREHVIWMRESDNPQRLRHPLWAAYITARARIALHKKACEVGIERVIDGHTDALTFHGRPLLQSADRRLGSWRVTGIWQRYRAFGSTVSVALGTDGIWHTRGLTAQMRKKIPPEKRIATPLAEIGGENWLGIKRRLPRQIRSPSWVLQPDGTSRPTRTRLDTDEKA